jgi:hypothetical protein
LLTFPGRILMSNALQYVEPPHASSWAITLVAPTAPKSYELAVAAMVEDSSKVDENHKRLMDELDVLSRALRSGHLSSDDTKLVEDALVGAMESLTRSGLDDGVIE